MGIDMLIGAAIFAAGALLGRFLPARKRGPKPIKPICGCSHHHSMHDPETGQCHGLVSGGETAARDAKNNPVLDDFGYVQKTYAKVQCSCRRYSGPEPLPEYSAPEIGP
jgi:hypothetical protein